MSLRIMDGPPAGLLDLQAHQLHGALGDGPVLIRFAGLRRPPLVVVALLHGNETSGWLAVRRLVARHKQLGRELLLVLGNLAAAAQGRRMLDGHPDWNRIWSGPEQAHFAAQTMEALQAEGVFATIDIHNNSGRNPHYAIVFDRMRDCQSSVDLAACFCGLAVRTRVPEGTCAGTLIGLAPAITLECGQSGDETALQAAVRLIELCMGDELPPPPAGARILRTEARARVPRHHSLTFGNGRADINFPADLERHNFRSLSTGTHLADLDARVQGIPLQVDGPDDDSNLFEHYFALDGRRLCTARPFIPAMLVADERAVRDDCLCYLMTESGAS